jgi:hypothetical protein
MLRALMVSLFVLAPLAGAQVSFSFRTNDSASDFAWAGTSNYGNVIGNPSSAFELHGSVGLDVASSGVDPIAGAQFVHGPTVHIVPDLQGQIPNILPFLPPLATISVVDTYIEFSSAAFSVQPNGSFTTAVTLRITEGTMHIVQLVGPPASLDLTGFLSDPDVHTGSLTQVGTTMHLALPITTTFPFDFSSQGGATGTIDITGTLVADWIVSAPQVYCTARTNSLGCLPAIGAAGEASFTNLSTCTITATNELNQKSGLFYYGYAPAAVPFQGGFKCVSSPTIRTPLQNSGGSASGSDCTGAYSFDFGTWMQTGVDAALVPGREIYGQYWSRDPQAFPMTNLTDAVRIEIAL